MDEELRSHRERLEDLLKERTIQVGDEQAKFQHLIETLPMGLAMTDPQGRLDYCNPALLKMAGYDLHEMAGRLLADFLGPGSREVLVDCLQSGTPPEAFEGTFRAKDDRCVLLRIFPGNIPAVETGGPSLFAVVEQIPARQ